MNKRKREWTRDDMDIFVQNEMTGTKLIIEYPDYYEEDYQLPMLRANEIPRILKVELAGVGAASQFSYEISGMTSMQKRYEKEKMTLTDLQDFVKQFMEMADGVQNYMLDENQLLLVPEYIFWKEDCYYFCYLPVASVPLFEQFRKLTEFFVKQIDYSDMECIFFAHKLNRESMEDQYSIGTILEQYQQEAKARHEEQNKPLEISRVDTQERSERENFWEENLIYEDTNTVREMGGFLNQFERITSRIKKKRWGGWQDLILESDRQERESIL